MWRNSPQSMFQHRHRRLRREHGLTGKWTLTSKDDSQTDLNWTTAYSGGMQNDSGSGTIKGKSSEVSTRAASGSYSSGATSGSYSEDWKSNLNGNTDLNLKREKNGAWTSNGAASGSSSGNTDWSDKTNLVTTSALYDITLTTTTDTDTGRHYEYNMSTSRKLRRNTWSAYEGSGTGKGSGWAYLTTDTSGTATVTIATPSDPLELYAWGRGTPAEKQLTQTIKGDSSDKLDYKYDNEFTLTKTGWANSETGSGTWDKRSHYESSVSGSVSETGTGQFGLFSHTYRWGTNLKFQASISTDQEIIRDSNSTATFNWNNDGWSVTEKTTTSSKNHNSTDSDYNAQLWYNSGNVGAGNGTSETANMSWASTYKHDVTESSETTQSLTTGKGGVVWNAKYTSSEKDVTTSSLDEVRHSESQTRVNTVTDGVYSTSKFDSYSDVDIHNTGKNTEVTNENWQSSFDGKAYGTSVDAWDQTITSEGTSFNKSDTEYSYTSRSWNASGIISQYAEGYAFHSLVEGNPSYTETEIDTTAGLQPTFMAGALSWIFAPISMSGAGARGASAFSFSVPTMTMDVGGGITFASLPELTLKTIDFDQIGQPGDTRTYWQGPHRWANGANGAGQTGPSVY